MGKDMPEVHTNIQTTPSGTQVVFHNPGRSAQAPSAGQPITATVKSVGQPNAAVHGQVPNSSIVFDNPGQ